MKLLIDQSMRGRHVVAMTYDELCIVSSALHTYMVLNMSHSDIVKADLEIGVVQNEAYKLEQST